jgi:nitrogen-specific signal transduction histidine kinase
MESSFEDFGNVMKSSLSQTFQSLRSLNSELQRSLNSELQRSLNPELQRLLNSELQQNKRTDSSEKDDPGIVIKEIYHALATPLSLAEAGLLNADLQLSTATQTEMRERLITVLTGVQTCKAIMAGFREVILAAKSSGTWAPPSLHEIVLSVSKAVAEQMKKELKIVSTLPDSFKGYSNNYIVTAMLPLIENAIDAARPNSEILIQTRAGNVLFMIDVTSTPDATPVSDSIYKDGVTTKPGHSGTGLSIVQHLISGRPKSSLRHKVNGDNVIFTITLPVGE